MTALAMTDSHAEPELVLRLRSQSETARLGARIARLLRVGDVVALSGALGAGKTTLARGIIRAFLPDEEVPSPTFTLVQAYETPGLALWHVDLYRVKSQTELRELGLDEALEAGAILVEWPERLGAWLPEDRLDVALEIAGERGGRIARLTLRGRWALHRAQLR
jgi:tRNA threonylcarbamoyladenosine biosynthesis protein TsaE